MVAILMMPAKLATQIFLKQRYFEIKVKTSKCLSMTSPTKFYHVNQIILEMRSLGPKFGKSSISMRNVT